MAARARTELQGSRPIGRGLGEAPKRMNSTIRLNPYAVARSLGVVAVALVLAHIGGQVSRYWLGHGNLWGFVPLFNIDSEQNIPSVFSVLLLFCAALLLALITRLKSIRREPDGSTFAVLAVGFLLMTIDESVSIHERMVEPIRHLFGDVRMGIFYFAWVIPGLALVGAVAVYFSRFLWSLPPRMRFLFISSGLLYVGGALGIELLQGRYVELYGRDTLAYGMIAAVEEGLEMGGVIAFIYSLLEYIRVNYAEVAFRIEDARLSPDATPSGNENCSGNGSPRIAA